MVRELLLVIEYGEGVIVKELQKKPEIVVFAGPNGSGNSTFTVLIIFILTFTTKDRMSNI